LKWDKNKRTKRYLWLVVDDAGVIGVLRCDVRHWFIWVTIDGGLDGGGGQCAGGYIGTAMGAWTGAVADALVADAPAATLEAATGA
jgi:hypothetical protein